MVVFFFVSEIPNYKFGLVCVYQSPATQYVIAGWCLAGTEQRYPVQGRPEYLVPGMGVPTR